MLKNIIKIARLLAGKDDGRIRQGSVETMGKFQTIQLITPYGLMHNPPANSMVVMLSQQGQESNGIGMADDPANRTLKGLAPGEVAVGNYESGSYILFDAQGGCTIVAKSLTAIIEADAIVESQAVSLVSPSVTNNGINIGYTHTHPQGNDSGGSVEQDTGVPQ